MTPHERTGLILKEQEKRLDAMHQLADKLATIASAALAITVTFTDKMPTDWTIWLLRASWIGFIATVAGFFFIHLSKVRMHYDLGNKLAVEDGAYILARPIWYFHLGRYLLFVGFISGLLSLALYGFTR